MTAELSIVGILKADTTYNTLNGGRIYYDEAEQTKTFPLTVVSNQGTDTNDTKSRGSDFDFDLVQVLNMARTKQEAVTMAKRARLVIEGCSEGNYNLEGFVSGRMIDSDSFTEQIIDNKVYTHEQIYRVINRQ